LPFKGTGYLKGGGKTDMMVSLVAAMARNGVIGKDNALPWRLPADMRRFRSLTLGKYVLMGRKTFESIGRPLSGRTNLVLTRDPGYVAQGCIVVPALARALELAGGQVMVIGGMSVYEQCLPRAARLYLTLIHRDFAGDARFPAYDEAHWTTVVRDDFPADKENPFPYSFLELQRRW
jgi:dihydrofolate reductase